jgi:hypothetical protein
MSATGWPFQRSAIASILRNCARHYSYLPRVPTNSSRPSRCLLPRAGSARRQAISSGRSLTASISDCSWEREPCGRSGRGSHAGSARALRRGTPPVPRWRRGRREGQSRSLFVQQGGAAHPFLKRSAIALPHRGAPRRGPPSTIAARCRDRPPRGCASAAII